MHVITGLEVGGAETVLCRLLAASCMSRYEHEVVSMTTIGPIGERIAASGVPVTALGMRNGMPDPRSVWQLSRIMRKRAPALVKTWMYHADLLGGLAAKKAGGIPVVWGIRQNDVKAEKLLKKILARVINPLLSYSLPDAIVCCAEEARKTHAGFGYARKKLCVIPNGFDLERFRPDEKSRREVRAELGVPSTALLVGMVTRMHPMKDIGNFLKAAGRVAQELPNSRFLLCGEGMTGKSAQLESWRKDAGLPTDRLLLLGRVSNVERLYPALDLYVSSSLSEGFPNVLGEAMACGVPCVATDVGESSLIVGDTGDIVPSRNVGALTGAILGKLRLSAAARRSLGQAARDRIAQNYSLPTISAQYAALFDQIIQGRAAKR
jgi:glycosyltransferase involved in cell wall biosynthesis